MKEIYNGETVALGGVNLVTKQVVVDDSTGEKAKFTYDKTTGAVTVLDTVDPDSINPVTARAVANAVAGASGEIPIIGDGDNGKVLKAVVDGSSKSVAWGEVASGLPASTQADAGKVLTVDNEGDPAWAQQSGGDVTTASGYFRLGGSTPVKVNYTGSVEQIVTPESLDVDDHTKYLGETVAQHISICTWFDNTDGLKDLGTEYTATLKMKAASLLAGFPEGVRVQGATPIFYCNDSSWTNPQGPNTSGQLVVTDNDIKEQTVTVSGPNQAGASSGYGAYLGFIVNIDNATDPATGSYYNLADALNALIANIEAGNVFELVWPVLTPGTDTVTTIPNVPSNVGQNNKFLKAVQTGATTYEMQWAEISQVPPTVSSSLGKVFWALGTSKDFYFYFQKEALTADSTNNVFKTRLMYKSQFFIVLRAIDNSASPRNMVPMVKGTNLGAYARPLSMISNGDGVSVGVGFNDAQGIMEISFVDTATNTVIPVSDLTIDYCYMVVLGNQT